MLSLGALDGRYTGGSGGIYEPRADSCLTGNETRTRTEMANRARRARSLEREAQPEVLDRLADVLEGIHLNQRNQPRNQFKPPQFGGEGDVELFIRQFQEVAEANQWTRMATLLHLRESLTDKAQTCSRADQPEGIFAALRSRFGLTPREARTRLTGLRRDSRCPLHDHAVEVERLVQVAYAELPEHIRADMALETFCGSLGSVPLQQHLLAARPANMEEAVRYGSEFLQVKGDRGQTGSKVNLVDDPETDQVAVAAPEPTNGLLQAIEKLAAKIEKLELRAGTENKSKKSKCWGCGKEGHTRKVCKTDPWPNQPTSAQPGNGSSPQ